MTSECVWETTCLPIRMNWLPSFQGMMKLASQPLSRKVPIPSSKINPHRMVIILRLVVLSIFLHYRLTNHVRNAYVLWLLSVICKIWFAMSWILDQFPKWFPINCETYLDRLALRICKDMCTFLQESIKPRAPEWYFTQKVDYLENKVHTSFVKDRSAMKREYEEFKVRINQLVTKAQKVPTEGWIMQDGTPWPSNNTRDHPGMIQQQEDWMFKCRNQLAELMRRLCLVSGSIK